MLLACFIMPDRTVLVLLPVMMLIAAPVTRAVVCLSD